VVNPLNDFAPLHETGLLNTSMTRAADSAAPGYSPDLDPTIKDFYDRMLLERTVPNLHHLRFGSVKRIPMHSGKVIEWRKFEELNDGILPTTPLVEGELFTDLKKLKVTAITGTVAQYGDAVGFSDIVQTVTIDPLLAETTALLAEQASQTIDSVTRDVLAAGGSVVYANGRTSRATIAATDNFLEMDGAGGTQAGGSLADLRFIALTLELNRARRINGYWQAITHPRVMFDIQGTVEWREAQLYNQTNRIFDGSVGEMYGIKFWTTDVATIITDGGVTTTDVYVTLVFGENAFGTIRLAGHNLQTVYKPLGSAGTADALNQQATMGWKAVFGTKVLYDEYYVRYEGAASTGDNA
jgi:N4-gp56 family major capsid protein